MAKDSDHRAGPHEADNFGGTLSGLFAEENEHDRRTMLRLGSWGVTAVAAVVLAVMANQSQLGWRREQVASVDLARQAHQIQMLTKETQNETRRLAFAIDTLNSDRDRLFSRVTVVEQGLDSVTGALARKNTSAEPPKPASMALPPAPTMPLPAVASESPPPQPDPAQNQATTPSLAPVLVAAARATTPEKPRTEAAKPDPAPAVAALPQIAAIKPAVPLPGAILPAPTRPTAPATLGPAAGAAKSMMGPPGPMASRSVESAVKPIEPAKEQAGTARVIPSANAAPPSPPAPSTATTPAQVGAVASREPGDKVRGQKDQDKPASDIDEANSTIRRTEFAVELGGANSIGGLRALWRGLLKSNNAELAELRPIIVLRESNSGLGMQLRLAAGPLNDAAEAAKICASLVENKRSCETTVFDGQRLAMGADAPSAASSATSSKQARQQSYRRNSPKRAKSEEPPPAPTQEPSTFSSLFGAGKR